MKIAEKIKEKQNKKEMTRKAIKLLENMGENVDNFKAEFLKIYGEEV